MGGKENKIHPKDVLDENDRLLITEIFYDDIEPRLIKMQARIGTLNCEFAGEQYKNWVMEFRSNRSGFEIVGFEYDENSRGFDLAPKPHIPQLDKYV